MYLHCAFELLDSVIFLSEHVLQLLVFADFMKLCLFRHFLFKLTLAVLFSLHERFNLVMGGFENSLDYVGCGRYDMFDIVFTHLIVQLFKHLF